jgi:membrane-associated phospholipid phosphatase
MWILIFALFNIILFVFSIYFLLNRKIIKKIPLKPKFFIERFLDNWLNLIIIFMIVGFHLIEVKFIDPIVTDWVGLDYADIIQSYENGIVNWFSHNWTPGLLQFFVLIYIIIYTFTLWFSPFYFIIGNKKKAMKSLVYGLLIIYIISLPFYLFLPVTNVYTFYGTESPLEQVFPSIESFFYATTTTNNCLPSMHTAMTILIAYCLGLTGNRKLKFFGYFVMVSVMISVIYLSIHWITDVLIGAILSLGGIFILRRYIKDK